MSKSKLLKSCQILLVVNIIFWLFIVLSSLFGDAGESNFIVIALLLAEPVLYFVSLVGITKKVKLIYLLSIILASGNTVLSITDQVGILDIISLFLSALVLLNLIVIWNYIFKNPKETGY